KHVATGEDLELLIEAVISDEYSLMTQSIRSVLNLTLYLNLYVDACGRGSDLAYGGPSVAEKPNHCLCWNHCRFFVVNTYDGDRVIAANIAIKYSKGQRRKDLEKIVSLRLLPSKMAAYDSLRLLVTLGLVDGVFGKGATWESLLAINPGAHSREIVQSAAFIETPVFRSHRQQPLLSGKLGESIVRLGRLVGFEHSATAYTLRRGYSNMLNVKASIEDRKLNTNDDIIAATSDALDWVERLEHEEESAENLGDYETITAGDSWSHKTRIEASDSPDLDLSAADKTVQTPLDSHTTDAIQLSEASNANAALRLHGINDGSARPKNMTITRVRDVMSSGGLPDATLSQIMVEVFSATHNPGKYIPGEEPLLGTSICRFSGLDLSSDTHSPETVHRAHLKVLQRSPNDLFNSHLLPLDTPCTYYSQGPTKKKSPKLCGYYTINTRYQQIQHVAGHVLRGNRLGHESGYIPDGEWHCFYEGCAVLTTIPSTKRGVVAKVLLSTTSVFLSKRVFLRHVYQVHRLSALAIESVVWCGICERFLEWDQFAAGTDEHFEMHWDEVWKLVADHGYTGQFDNGRRTIPSFCPFCLYDESLSPTERISTSMNFIDRSGFSKHIGMHLDNIDSGPIHGCPCFPKTCLHQGKMTPAELDVHLSEVHGIHRYPSSRADRNGNTKNGKILSEKPVNIQARPSKKHKWPQAPTHTMSAVDQ
ncbi:hypothetical protein F5882DRAFT_312058, partial [Hyaloscypha sp. PMI_1271]